MHIRIIFRHNEKESWAMSNKIILKIVVIYASDYELKKVFVTLNFQIVRIWPKSLSIQDLRKKIKNLLFPTWFNNSSTPKAGFSPLYHYYITVCHRKLRNRNLVQISLFKINFLWSEIPANAHWKIYFYMHLFNFIRVIKKKSRNNI